MKKFILSALPLLICASSSALAAEGVPPAGGSASASDSIRAMLSWSYNLPVVVPGHAFTLTGESGKPLEAGKLHVYADGSFKSEPVALELHTFDEDSYKVGGLVDVGKPDSNNNTVQKIGFKVDPNGVKLKSSDDVDLSIAESGATVSMDGSVIDQSGTDATNSVTQWTVEGSNLPALAAGSTVEATTYVIADVSYAESK